MALSAVEVNNVLQILHLLQQDTAYFTNTFGVNVTLTQLTTLTTQVRTIAANLTADQEQEVREGIEAYRLVKWTNSGFPNGGDIGPIRNFVISAQEERRRIEEVLVGIFAVMTWAQGIGRRDEALGDSGTLSVE